MLVIITIIIIVVQVLREYVTLGYLDPQKYCKFAQVKGRESGVQLSGFYQRHLQGAIFSKFSRD